MFITFKYTSVQNRHFLSFSNTKVITRILIAQPQRALGILEDDEASSYNKTFFVLFQYKGATAFPLAQPQGAPRSARR